MAPAPLSGGNGPGPGPRPALHFTAPRGWINDPLGVTYRRDRYHAYYQAVPDSLDWQRWCGWGHATSPDLVRWTTHPTALPPGDGDVGCWSGDVAVSLADGSAALFYTSVREPDLGLGVIRVAHPVDDDWTVWRKGPVVVSPPPAEALRMFRDPTLVRDGGGWLMLVGAGTADDRAAVLSFTSADLRTWTYSGPFLTRRSGPTDPFWTGTGWECPHLVSAGGRDVLVVSVWSPDEGGDHVVAATGTRVGTRMSAERWDRLTYGPSPYAPTSFTDADGLPCLMFWMRGVADRPGGWAGALSIPYRLGLAADGGPALDPHPAIRRAGAGGRPGVVGVDWAAGTRAPTGTLTLRSPAGDTVARLVAAAGALQVETSGETVEAPLGDGPTSVLLDRCVLEICTGRAVIGFPVPGPVGADEHPLTVTGGDLTRWWR